MAIDRKGDFRGFMYKGENMKIKEFIHELSRYPDDTEVYIEHGDEKMPPTIITHNVTEKDVTITAEW